MLGEGVDASPDGNQQAVEELLAFAGASEPQLSHKEDDRQDDAVSDESTPHDEMRQTLPDMITLFSAESQCGDCTKKYLHPAGYRHRFPHDSMGPYSIPA